MSPSYNWGITVQCGAPPVISWFINHEIIPINYSYIYHKPLNSATYVHQRFTLSLDWGPHPVWKITIL